MDKLAKTTVDEFRMECIEALMGAWPGVHGPTNIFLRAMCSVLVNHILARFHLELSEEGARDSKYLSRVYQNEIAITA